MNQTNYNAKILVCYHKQDKIKSDEIYLPIQGGKAISNIDLGIQGDNTGDNISIKNKTYCELTNIYWAWKNLKNVDYIGLCHYRRFFNFKNKGTSFNDYTPIKSEDFEKLDLSTPDFNQIFSKYDIILAKPVVYSTSIYVDYCINHYSEDINILEKIVERNYPELRNTMYNLFHNTNKISHYNMFVMKWDAFDKYCNWLFEILKTAENEINITNYTDQQKRIWGFMAERLLLLYTNHNNLKTKYYPVYHINDYVKFKSTVHRFQRNLRKELSFKIIHK